MNMAAKSVIHLLLLALLSLSPSIPSAAELTPPARKSRGVPIKVTITNMDELNNAVVNKPFTIQLNIRILSDMDRLYLVLLADSNFDLNAEPSTDFANLTAGQDITVNRTVVMKKKTGTIGISYTSYRGSMIIGDSQSLLMQARDKQ